MFDSSAFKDTRHLTPAPKPEFKKDPCDDVVCRRCHKKVNKFTEAKYAYYGEINQNRYFYCLACAGEYQGTKTLRVLEYDYYIQEIK